MVEFKIVEFAFKMMQVILKCSNSKTFFTLANPPKTH